MCREFLCKKFKENRKYLVTNTLTYIIIMILIYMLNNSNHFKLIVSEFSTIAYLTIMFNTYRITKAYYKAYKEVK